MYIHIYIYICKNKHVCKYVGGWEGGCVYVGVGVGVGVGVYYRCYDNGLKACRAAKKKKQNKTKARREGRAHITQACIHTFVDICIHACMLIYIYR